VLIAQCGEMFVIYLYLMFFKPTFRIIVIQKVKKNCMVAMFIFYIVQKIYLYKSGICFEDLVPCTISGCC
jgi:hypothetical protein